MTFITGSTSGPKWTGRLRELGWGRMVVRDLIRPYPGEPWGLDNGAFVAWRNGTEWDGGRFLKRVRWAAQLPEPPYLAVLPDRVTDPGSLRHSMEWYERVGNYPLPWYLAVQDGMDPDLVRGVLPFFRGLFLGGSNAFKATAAFWCRMAHEQGRLFHYARAGTPRKLQHALDVGADSADSAFPLWSEERFQSFLRFWRAGSPQLRLFIPEGVTT